MRLLDSIKNAFIGGAAGGGKTEAMEAEVDRQTQRVAVRRMRRSWLKSKRRFHRWPVVRPQTATEKAHAYNVSLENGLMHRAFERVGKPRSKYSPDVCFAQGHR